MRKKTGRERGGQTCAGTDPRRGTRNAKYVATRRLHTNPLLLQSVSLATRKEASALDQRVEEEPATLLLFWLARRHEPISDCGVGGTRCTRNARRRENMDRSGAKRDQTVDIAEPELGSWFGTLTDEVVGEGVVNAIRPAVWLLGRVGCLECRLL